MKRSNRILVQFISLIALLVSLSNLQGSAIFAQEPIPWQESATGLSVTQNEAKKTAGLEVIVQAESWPFLSLRGGVKDAGSGKLGGPVGIELGSIKVPGGQSVSLLSEVTDWAHNELTFSTDTPSQLKLWVSRLSPAILIQSSAKALRLLAGNVTGNRVDGSIVTVRPPGPAYPKFVAYKSGGILQIRTLGTIDIALPALDQNWLLIWYGNNSHFVETKEPLTYADYEANSRSVPQKEAYQADAPLLLVFENQPTTIKHSSEGGIDFSFTASAGYVTLLPLLGRDHPKAADTESWVQGLPTTIAQKAQWWANHLCAYPNRVSETYAYDEGTDTSIISENISYLNVCSGGTSFAPIPPLLGLVKDSLQVAFSGTVVDANLPTEFGPSLGLENTNQYTWSVTGLKKYTDVKRQLGTGQAPPELMQELESAVQKIIAAGHFAPWIFIDNIPRGTYRGDLYWANPADIIYHLIEIAEALPDGNLKNNLINYIKTERTTYPPEDVSDLELDPTKGAGTVRLNFSYYGATWEYSWKVARKDVHLQDVPLYSYFALARYYNFTGEPLPVNLLNKAKTTLQRDMSEQDWATFYWFKGYQDRRIAVVNANQHFAGLVGFIRLAEMAKDKQAENLSRALLAKAVVLRLGMAKYPRYLYSVNLVELPPEPNWQPRYTEGNWMGHLYNYKWTGPFDDPRQVAKLDQFEVYLFDHSGMAMQSWDEWNMGPTSAHLIAYQDMAPELARLLSDYAKADVEIYVNKVEALFPHWYLAFAEGMLGAEHNLSHPIDSFQIFMAKALIQQETPEKLAGYVDIPWLEAGDLFYVHKLAETIKAYRGYSWQVQ